MLLTIIFEDVNRHCWEERRCGLLRDHWATIKHVDNHSQLVNMYAHAITHRTKLKRVVSYVDILLSGVRMWKPRSLFTRARLTQAPQRGQRPTERQSSLRQRGTITREWKSCTDMDIDCRRRTVWLTLWRKLNCLRSVNPSMTFFGSKVSYSKSRLWQVLLTLWPPWRTWTRRAQSFSARSRSVLSLRVKPTSGSQPSQSTNGSTKI